MAYKDLSHIEIEAVRIVDGARSIGDLESFRIKYLGRKGKIPLLLRKVKDMPLSERRKVGKKANILREVLEKKYKEAKARIINKGTKKPIDVTAPGRRPFVGHLHPLTQVRRDIEDTFLRMGFEIASTPEVEDARHHFDLVNIPLGHPARDMMDTFWLTDGRLLRAHTTSGQIRVMGDRTPPFRVLIPGRVFRREATDATHETTFYQFEGLFVDTDVSLAHGKGIIEESLSTILHHTDIECRIRPSYFPFVEPGIEVDISCYFCAKKKRGEWCSICKGTQWIEVMGAGMIHPIVLKNAGIDPRKFRGFAFGGCIDRIAMLRFGIQDIRLFWSGNTHLLHQL